VAKEEKPILTEEEFVIRAIRKLRKAPYKGIHSVYSGFNQAFKEYFGTSPVEASNTLAQEEKIAIRPVKGGVMLYLPEDAPGSSENVLGKILEEEEEVKKEKEEEPEEEIKILGPAESGE